MKNPIIVMASLIILGIAFKEPFVMIILGVAALFVLSGKEPKE